MNKVLVFDAPQPFDRTMVWDITDKHNRSAAYVNLFRIFDQELDAFAEDPDTVVCALIKLARAENPEACEALLCYMRDGWDLFREVELTNPTGPKLDWEPRRVVQVEQSEPEVEWVEGQEPESDAEPGTAL